MSEKREAMAFAVMLLGRNSASCEHVSPYTPVFAAECTWIGGHATSPMIRR